MNHLQRHRYFYVLVVVVILLGLAFVPFYRYQINPDGIGYIGVAQKYAAGNIRHAINGYWGPLLSWLMVPGLLVSIDPIITIKLLQLGLVVGIMAIVYATTLQVIKKQWLRLLLALLCGLIALRWAYVGPLTPDLLVCFLSLLLLYIALRQFRSPSSHWLPVAFGATGACLFFAKSIGFYLFLTTWLCCVILQHVSLRNSKWQLSKKRWRNSLCSLVVFVVLVLPFIALISVKYHHPTIGTSGSYNFAYVGPRSVGHPVANSIVPPPNPTAVSGWEDISNISVTRWSPFESTENMRFFSNLIYKNLLFLHKVLGFAFLLLLPLTVMFFVSRDKTPAINRYKTLVVVFSLLNIAAYLPIFIEERYIYFVFIMIIIGSACLLDRLQKSHRTFIAITVVLYLFIGGYNLILLRQDMHIGKKLYHGSQSLTPYLNNGVRLGSDDFASLYACYYTNAVCMGVINSNWPDLLSELKKNNINYLLIYPESAPNIINAGVDLELMPNTSYNEQVLYRVVYP